jgi:hypothetical protein
MTHTCGLDPGLQYGRVFVIQFALAQLTFAQRPCLSLQEDPLTASDPLPH